MTAQQLIRPDENDERISVWREENGRFSIRDMWDRDRNKVDPEIQLNPDLAEEIANAILKSILVNGR